MRKFLAILVCKLGRAVGARIGKGSSLPGKVAPVTAGAYIRDTIYNILHETKI